MATRLLDWSDKVPLGSLVAGICRGSLDTTPACPPDSCPPHLPLSIASLVCGTQLHREPAPANCSTSVFPWSLSLAESDLNSDFRGHICCFREKILPGSLPVVLEWLPSAHPLPHRDQDKACVMAAESELLTGDRLRQRETIQCGSLGTARRPGFPSPSFETCELYDFGQVA